MKKKSFLKLSLTGWLFTIFFQLSCHQPEGVKKDHFRHLAEIHKNGLVLYIDKVDSRQVIKSENYSAFSSYKIGFVDSMPANKKMQQEQAVYFDYRMGNDWKAVIGSDSIAPVYFQPVTGLNKMIKEGILVFELPHGKQPDALVYNDSFGDWQQQTIALNQNFK